MRNAFRERHSRTVSGSHLILVDDVFTTGSTVDECARVLVESGVASVRVIFRAWLHRAITVGRVATFAKGTDFASAGKDSAKSGTIWSQNSHVVEADRARPPLSTSLPAMKATPIPLSKPKLHLAVRLGARENDDGLHGNGTSETASAGTPFHGGFNADFAIAPRPEFVPIHRAWHGLDAGAVAQKFYRLEITKP